MGLLKSRRTHRILSGGKKNRTEHKPRAAKLRDPQKSKVRVGGRATGTRKVRNEVKRDAIQTRKERKVKENLKKIKTAKRNKKEEEEDDGLDEQEVEEMEAGGAYYFPTEQV